METKPLGTSEVHITPIIMGTWQKAGGRRQEAGGNGNCLSEVYI